MLTWFKLQISFGLMLHTQKYKDPLNNNKSKGLGNSLLFFMYETFESKVKLVKII